MENKIKHPKMNKKTRKMNKIIFKEVACNMSTILVDTLNWQGGWG